MTFLSAPPNCAPIRSVPVYTRKAADMNTVCRCAVRAASCPANKMVVGLSRLTSAAKLGPVRTVIPFAQSGGSSSSSTWDIN